MNLTPFDQCYKRPRWRFRQVPAGLSAPCLANDCKRAHTQS